MAGCAKSREACAIDAGGTETPRTQAMLGTQSTIANNISRAGAAARASAAMIGSFGRSSHGEDHFRRAGRGLRAADRSLAAPPRIARELAEQSLYQMLLDEGESINRLYRIVSQAGCDILFYGESGDLIGRYGKPRSEWHRVRAAGRSNGRLSARADAALESDGGILFARDLAASRHAGAGPFASPVYDPDGRLVGSLDLSRFDGAGAEMPAVMQTLVHTTAQALEERAFRSRYAREWVLALVPREGIGGGILLAVDRRQRVVGADRRARTTLLRGKSDALPIALWSLFEKNPAIFRYAHVGDMPAVLTTLRAGEAWSALLTPPASQSAAPGGADAHARPRLDLVGCLRPQVAVAASRGGLAPRAVQRVRAYVEDHLAENIRLEALAQVAGLSRCHFVRAFKQSVGITPHAYLMQRRLERAEKLLLETDHPLCRVALDSGFSDQSHFSSYFRRNFGMSPRSFRRSRQ